MIAFIRHLVRRRRLRPVVVMLPQALLASYGSAGPYRFPQVARALERARLDSALLPSAAAAFCTLEEFQRGRPGASEAEYRALREEIDRLFALGNPDFTAETIRSSKIKQVWNPSEGGGM